MVLAPAGLKAVLTGQSLPSTDARAARILKEWERFYPVIKDERSNGFIPCLVEIVHSESKMLYPSCLVGVPVQRQGNYCEHITVLPGDAITCFICFPFPFAGSHLSQLFYHFYFFQRPSFPVLRILFFKKGHILGL